MQSKFTLNKIGRFFMKTCMIICLALSVGASNAQTTISTASGVNYLGNYSINNGAPLVQSFVIQNTNASAVVLTNISMQLAPYFFATAGAPTTLTLFYSSTSLSGNYTVGSPAWTQIAVSNTTVPAALTVVPIFSGLSFIIPAGAQYRFAVEATFGLAFSFSPTPTPNVFSAGGVNLQVGDFQIAAANVGFAGLFPTPNAGNTPTFFGGSITYSSAVPCSGTPNPGNTVASSASVCPGTNVNLSLQNTTPGTGVTYQWQSSAVLAGPYTTIGGATNSTYSTLVPSPTYFRATVTCSGNTGTSTPVLVSVTPVTGCYCIPTANCTLLDAILNVTMGGVSNSSGCGTGYSNYTAANPPGVIPVFGGAANPISVTIDNGGGDNIGAWIDYNQNGIFEPSEYTNIGTTPGGTVTNIINIPGTALTGITRMRVRVQYFTTILPTDGCTNFVFGETEDYAVNIQTCVPVTITSSPSNASINCSANASFTVATSGSGATYGWEFRVNAAAVWQTVPNAAPYSGTNTPTLTLTNIPQSFSGYQFRALVTGFCSALDYSNTATLTIIPLVATVSPTSATICTGSIQQLTLTNLPAPIVFSSGPISVAIPDNTAAATTQVLAVSGLPALVPSEIRVTLNMPHTYPADMVFNLKAPNGQILSLYKHNTNTDNGAASIPTAGFYGAAVSSIGITVFSSVPTPYQYGITPPTGPFKPDALNGVSNPGYTIMDPTGFVSNAANFAALATILNGNWTLAMCDGGPGDFGTLTSWSISFSFGSSTGVWTAAPAAPNTMFTNAGATIPYVAGSQAGTIWVNPTVSTNYSVVYSTTTPCVSAPTVIPVTVVNPVTAVVNPANTSVCLNGNATFSTSATGGPLTYQWQVSIDAGLTYTNIGGATSSTLTVSGVTQAMSGNRYRAVITAAPCGSVNSGAAILTVNQLPVVTINSADLSLTPGQTTTITASSVPAAATANSWSWTFNGSPLSPAVTTNSITVGIDALGAYQAKVTDVNGCVNTSNILTVLAEASDRLWIYPNPTTGLFQVRLYYDGATSDRRVLSVIDQLGHVVIQREFDLVSTTPPYLRMDIDATKLPAAIYFVQVRDKFTGHVTSGGLVKFNN